MNKDPIDYLLHCLLNNDDLLNCHFNILPDIELYLCKCNYFFLSQLNELLKTYAFINLGLKSHLILT